MDTDFYKEILEIGQCFHWHGNQRMPLYESDSIWIILSGEVAIFQVSEVDNRTAPDAQHYLFSLTEGNIFFSVSLAESINIHLVAISIEPSKVVQLSFDWVRSRLEIVDLLVISLITHWLFCCQKILDEGRLKESDDLILALNSDEVDRPCILPVSINNNDGNASLSISDSNSLQLTSLTFEQVIQANTQFLYYLEKQRLYQQSDEWEQFQLQSQLNYQVTNETISNLASVINSESKYTAPVSLTNHPTPGQKELLQLIQVIQLVIQSAGMSLRPIKLDRLIRGHEPLQTLVNATRLKMRRVILSDRWWRRDCGALLAYTRQDNRPIALLPVSPGRYEWVDPNQNVRLPLTPLRRSLLSPIAYMFYRSLPERSLKTIDVIKFALKGTGRDWQTVFWTGVSITGLSMLLPQGLAILIDQVVPSADRNLLTQLGFGLLAAVGGGLIFQLVQGTALLRIETLMEAPTQAAFWDRLLSLPVPFFRQFAIGDLRERVSVISTIRNRISGVIFRALLTGCFALLNLGLLVYYGGQLVWVALGVSLLMSGVTITSGYLIFQQLMPLQELEGRLFGLMVQLIHGVAKLRVSGAESRIFSYWGKQYQHQQYLKLKLQQLEDNLLVFNQLIPIISISLIFGLAAETSPLAFTQKLSTGTFLAFNVALGSFMSGITELSNILLSMLMVAVLWRQARPILQSCPEVDAGKTDPGQLSGRLQLDHVTFSYHPNAPTILNDVTISVEPGEFIAIVGASGSGKSTLFRLLLGFEQPQSGQVYYDGQDLRSLDIYAVRRQLGVLLQNSRTNTASIFDNIAGNALISMDEAWDAARYAGLADDIEAMPMGMHTIVSEGGSNLSGGQRQRLLIARSLALKPRILLFDEATSSLDNRTQAIVSDSLDRLKITRIVIAHRLSTIQNADCIYVLQSGRIVQKGKFADLIQQKGVFSQLMHQQIV